MLTNTIILESILAEDIHTFETVIPLLSIYTVKKLVHIETPVMFTGALLAVMKNGDSLNDPQLHSE